MAICSEKKINSNNEGFLNTRKRRETGFPFYFQIRHKAYMPYTCISFRMATLASNNFIRCERYRAI